MAAALKLTPRQHLTTVYQDRSAKGLVYLVLSRDNEWLLMAQSLPMLSKFLNSRLSNGQAYDTVSVTSLHDNLNRTDGRSGGFCKGRWRVRTVPLEECVSEFERYRADFENAVVIAADPRVYKTSVDSDDI